MSVAVLVTWVLLAIAGGLTIGLVFSAAVYLRVRQVLREAQDNADESARILTEARAIREKAGQQATDEEFWRIAAEEEGRD